MTTELVRPHVKAVWAETLSMHPLMGDSTAADGMPWAKEYGDLDHFRQETRDHVLIMGSTTFDRLPAHMKLPSTTKERPIIILTSRITEYIHATAGVLNIQPLDPTGTVEHGQVLDILQRWPEYAGKPIAVIGGAKVIEAFAPFYDELVVTQIPGAHQGDIPAPSLKVWERRGGWTPTSIVTTNSHNRPITIHRYTRKETN